MQRYMPIAQLLFIYVHLAQKPDLYGCIYLLQACHDRFFMRRLRYFWDSAHAESIVRISLVYNVLFLRS